MTSNLKNQIEFTITKGMVSLLENEKENNRIQTEKLHEIEKSIKESEAYANEREAYLNDFEKLIKKFK